MFFGTSFNPPPQVEGAQEGVVHSVDSEAHRVTVTMDESVFGTDYKFGPMPYASNGSVPQVGDRALVVFVDNDINRGWLVAWQEA